MNLKVKPLNSKVKKMYQNHGHYNKGDSGLDLFIIDDDVYLEQSISKFYQAQLKKVDLKYGVKKEIG